MLRSSLVRICRLAGSMLLASVIACTGPDGPAGPAGSPATLVTATGTGSLVVDDAVFNYAQVPGLTATVTVPAGSTYDLLIETDGGIQLESADPTAVGFVDLAVFVDGTQVGPGRRASASNNPVVAFNVGSYGFSTETTVPAGTHTVAVMAKFSVLTAAAVYVSSAASGSTLPGNPRLQGTLNVIAFP